MANFWQNLVKNRDNAELAEEGNAFGLGVDPTSLPLQPGLTNAELAAEQAPALAAAVEPSRAPATLQYPIKAPASDFMPSQDSGSAPAPELDISSRLENLLAERKQAMADAEDRQWKQNLVAGLSDNLGLLVGGAQAMNTKANVQPPKVAPVRTQDLLAIAEKKSKPELDAIMQQYKQLQADKLKEQDRDLKRAFLNLSEKQYQRGIGRDEDTNERFWAGHDQRGKKFEFQKEEKNELSDKQLESIAGFDKVDKLAEDLSTRASKFKGSLGPYASKAQNAKNYVPGLQEDPNFAAFKASVTDQMSGYIKSLSGLTVSDKERSQLMKSVPNIEDKYDVFMSKMKELRSRLKDYKSNELSAAQKYQGKTVKGAEGRTPQSAEETKVINGATYKKVSGGWEKVK